MGRLTLGKLCFGKDMVHYGLELCLARAGLTAYPVTTSTVTGCDILLVSMFWYRDIYALELFQRQSGIRKGGKPYILAGGIQATMTPEIVAELVDGVFIGDADDCLGELVDQIEADGTCTHPSVYTSHSANVPAPRVCCPSAFFVRTQEDKGTLRCEIARGCKYKCAFCSLSGLKPYSEVSHEELRPIIQLASRKNCSFFAPERAMHSQWKAIKEDLKRHKCNDMGQDARLENLQDVDRASVTFGLEGLSERLRRSIGKPFSDDMIIERLGEFVATRKNIARVSIYFIADLPGEGDSDWAAVRELFDRIEGEEWSRRLVLCPVLNPLSPKRFTKLENAHIHLFADYNARWQRLLRKDGGQWGFRVVESLVWGPLERTMDALVQRGGKEAYGVVRKMPDKLLKGKPPLNERARWARAIIREAEKAGISQFQLEGDNP